MKSNKKMLIILCSVTVAILLIVVIMMLVTGGKNKVLKYSDIESRIVLAGQNYYNDHKSELPEFGTISIDVSRLVDAGYMNDLSRFTKENVTCTGNLLVSRTRHGHEYRAKLDCGTDYSTQDFSNIIMERLVTDGSGLYEEMQINPKNGVLETVYVFKGDKANNYIKVGDYYWRIIKMMENGEMYILSTTDLISSDWDNRYNIETSNYNGINDYSISRVRDEITTNFVEPDTRYLKIKSLITTHNACVGKRSSEDESIDGSAECSEILEDQYFSLMPIYDYLNASLDENCNTIYNKSCYNYNYLATASGSWWTITGVEGSTQDIYYVDHTVSKSYANSQKALRVMALLNSNVTYVSGTGTYEDPYILK